MAGNVIEIKNKDEFEKEVLKGDAPVVVDFWAEWCMPCRMMAPVLEELATEMNDVRFFKVNVDEVRDVAMEYGIMSIPTFIVFKGGKEAGRIVGAMPKDVFRKKLEELLQ